MISQTSLLLVAVLAYGTNGDSVGNGVADTRIVNGETAGPGEFPHQISLQHNDQHFCGGSIISESFVLTAAHCTYKQSTSGKKVMTGTNKLDKPGAKYGVAKFINHPKYDVKKITNDIALVKVDKPISFNDLTKPIALGPKVDAGTDLVVSGWGYLSIDNPKIPNNLQKLNVKSIALEECQKIHANYGPWGAAINADQICTFTGDKNMRDFQGACKGDSGGPLINPESQQLIGVVSWGKPCAKGFPDLFTLVAAFKEWIAEEQKKNA